jgi:hypothetical protein
LKGSARVSRQTQIDFLHRTVYPSAAYFADRHRILSGGYLQDMPEQPQDTRQAMVSPIPGDNRKPGGFQLYLH